MALKYVVVPDPRWLRIQVRGEADFEAMRKLIDELAGVASQKRAVKMLVDLTGVTEKLLDSEHMALAERVTLVFSHMKRLAYVVPPQARRGIGDDVARQWGAGLRVFESEDEAVAWMA